MKKLLLMKTMLLLCALIVGSSSVWATEPDVTLDFTAAGADWGIPTSGTNKTRASFTNGDYTIYLCATTNYKANNGYLILGKKDSYLELPAFDFDVEKIEVLGHSGASAAVKQNIYVGDEAVSTETTGAAGITNTYAIASGYEAAGNVYKLVITSAHNTQIDYIKIYKKTSSGPVSVTGVSLNQTSLDLEVGATATLKATVTPNNATNKNISWESDDESVATVVDGVVTAVGVGTATITVTTDDGSYTATCTVTVKPAPAVSATFDFTSNTWGLPENSKEESENSYSNGTYTIKLKGSSANGYYFDTDNNNLLLGKTGATLTFPSFTFNVKKIIVYGDESASGSVTFNIFVGDDAVSTAAISSKVTHEFAIAAESQASGTKYVLKVTNSNNMRISKIEICGYETTPAVTADGWATYVTTNPCRFAEGDAFVVTSASDKVYLQSVTDVPNNTPVILKGAGAKTADVLPAASAITNSLAISNGGSIDGYVLAKKSGVVGFYKWAGGSLTSGKVYLPSSAVVGAREFLDFELGNENETTAIENVAKTQQTDGQYFNLAGQRVAQPTKGLYIVNGKKVIIK